MTRDLTQNELLGLLDWQRTMGADAALGEAPVDWLARGPLAPGADFHWPKKDQEPLLERDAERPPPAPAGEPPGPRNALSPATPARSAPSQQPPSQRTGARPQTPLTPSAAETDARRAARTATSLEALHAALLAFDGCGLKATATNLCFYRGATAARVMVIGEAPGRDEDIAGKPFVGQAGQLLDKMLAAIGLDETHVHITNIVYWRPPGNRTPTPQEAIACRPFLERQMELVGPDFVIALGDAAAKELFTAPEGIMRLRGKWRMMTIGSKQVPAMATLHPAYLLRTPAAKGLAWADLLALKAKLSLPR